MINELIDFFQAKGRFTECRNYVGMEASRIPKLFIDFFKSLESKKKHLIVDYLVSGALGKHKELYPYIPLIWSLMVSMCIQSYTGYFINRQNDLENEFNNKQNLAVWIESPNSGHPNHGLSFKKDWHCALMLWGILYLMNSNNIAKSYNYLLKSANSTLFKEGLIRAKEIYDNIIFAE